MKTKILLLFTCLIIFSSFKPLQQSDDNQLYKVIIFKWVKNEKGEEQKKVVIIDQDGSLIVNGQNIKSKVDINAFAKAINKFIKVEKLVKEPAYNGPPTVATPPNNGEQSISISVTKLNDFNVEKEFDYNSRYFSKKIKKSSDGNIDIYKYLQSDDLKVLKKVIQ
ncbi:hypothetical protein FLBR109950_15605 [Flavobacterium branchiophilum]|uniref:Uncharacterized protein n=1 Tax=Flavobacterium branchiophilum (strain FL-15) TaxID=1034807 RepID=G2Z275_FLABF|nr:hypothetical protein [Flavobacterium branchiophilum]CCB70030.1 Hypothetical protein precursor [Flavobacterium branchiophilum FL-15]